MKSTRLTNKQNQRSCVFCWIRVLSKLSYDEPFHYNLLFAPFFNELLIWGFHKLHRKNERLVVCSHSRLDSKYENLWEFVCIKLSAKVE